MWIKSVGDRNNTSVCLVARAVAGFVLPVVLLAAPPAWGAGGDGCDSAPLIGAVPYVDPGNTCAPFLNTYGEQCGAEGNSRDVVYAYSPVTNGCINILLCNSTSGVNFKLYVYASNFMGGCPEPQSGNTANDIACNDTFPGCGPYARINGLPVNAGVTYWIVVDGSSPACGDYLLEVQPCECTGPQDCADGNACTADLCQAGACQHPPAAAGTACGSPADTDCDNPDACDSNGLCQPNLEQPGTACGSPADTECDNPDSCDENGQCLSNFVDSGSACGSPSNTDCDDPDSCNAGGQCQANPALNGTACDDGQFCTVSEQCSGGACTGGQARVCDDGLACTDDSCNEEADACEFNPSGDCCQSAAECDDGDPCTLDQCVQGICQHPPAPQGTPCGDPGASTCTGADACDATGVCQPNHAADGMPCDDGDLCTLNDACTNGVCVGAADPACAQCAPSGNPADPTNQVSFQAVLRDAGGQLIDGSVDLVFQFYDDKDFPVAAPIAVNDVPVAGGVLSTAIPIAETIFDGTARELGISIDGTPELSPRIRVTSTPQAFRVGCVDGSSVTPHLGIGNETEGGALRLIGPRNGQVGRVASASAGVKAGVHVNCGGTLSLYEYAVYVGEEDTRTVYLNACDGPGGQTVLSASDGTERVNLSAGLDSEGGYASLHGKNGAANLVLRGGDSDNGALLTLNDGDGADSPMIELDADDDYGGGGGVIYVSNSVGNRTVEIDGDESNTPVVRLSTFGTDRIVLDASDMKGSGYIQLNDSQGDLTAIIGKNDGVTDPASQGGMLYLYQSNGAHGVSLNAEWTQGGLIRARDASGNPTVYIYGDYNGTGNGRVVTNELEITGGGDLSEQFDVLHPDGAAIQPGMVVVIDAELPGQLTVSRTSYDRRVAGVISGAGGVRPGMLMGQRDSVADGEHPVALTGRVYCWADATGGAIEPGDLLTTAERPGHAMKVVDYSRAQGAIIGKAMTPLNNGTGLVLVLVSLQ